AKYRKQYISAIKFLGAYYINVEKDKEKSLEFFTKWLEADPSNAQTIQPIIDQIKKMNIKQTPSPKGNAMPAKKTGLKPPVSANKKQKTTVVAKTASVKK
ncbi:MAG: hypothetical protein ABIP80_05940, partial [Ferruginibacter sp.]